MFNNAELKSRVENLEDRLKDARSHAQDLEQQYNLELKRMHADYERKFADVEANHAREVAALKYDIEHAEADTIEELEEENRELTEANSVLQKENEMLERITNLNGDVIDIKKLVTQLIDKLPEVKLNSLTVQSDGACKK